MNSLTGFTVGVKKGDNSINVLKENGITNIVEYDTAEAVVQAAKDQDIVIFILGKPPALYYLYKMHERSYRSPLPEETAINELQQNAGLQFDPELVKVFVEKVLKKL